MPYLIDGHNLIPKLGLRLDSMDDEMELVAILQEYARLERKNKWKFILMARLRFMPGCGNWAQ